MFVSFDLLIKEITSIEIDYLDHLRLRINAFSVRRSVQENVTWWFLPNKWCLIYSSIYELWLKLIIVMKGMFCGVKVMKDYKKKIRVILVFKIYIRWKYGPRSLLNFVFNKVQELIFNLKEHKFDIFSGPVLSSGRGGRF